MSADIGWILTNDVIGVKSSYLGRTEYVIVEVGGEVEVETVYDPRSCRLAWRDGRLLFDGADVETEEFMAYVGLLDAIEEEPAGVLRFGPSNDEDEACPCGCESEEAKS